MIELYSKYFTGKTLGQAKTSIMHDIKAGALTGKKLSNLLDELENNGRLRRKDFQPRPVSEWNADYLQSLSLGHISDYFSREYLLHFADVARHVTRRIRIKALIIAACVIGVIALSTIIILLFV